MPWPAMGPEGWDRVKVVVVDGSPVLALGL